MGCHTWFYRKIESPTIDYIKNNIKQKINKELEFLNYLIYNRDQIESDLLQAYPEWTIEYAQENSKSWNKILHFIDTGEINMSELKEFFTDDTYTEENILQNIYCFLDGGLIDYVEGRGFFKDCDEFHDVFRKGVTLMINYFL